MLEVNKELVLSTCHVEEGQLEIMEQFNYSSDQAQVRLHVESALLHVADGFETCDTVKTCLELAKSLDCKWLVLDCDGLEVEFLPKYEW